MKGKVAHRGTEWCIWLSTLLPLTNMMPSERRILQIGGLVGRSIDCQLFSFTWTSRTVSAGLLTPARYGRRPVHKTNWAQETARHGFIPSKWMSPNHSSLVRLSAGVQRVSLPCFESTAVKRYGRRRDCSRGRRRDIHDPLDGAQTSDCSQPVIAIPYQPRPRQSECGMGGGNRKRQN